MKAAGNNLVEFAEVHLHLKFLQKLLGATGGTQVLKETLLFMQLLDPLLLAHRLRA